MQKNLITPTTVIITLVGMVLFINYAVLINVVEIFNSVNNFLLYLGFLEIGLLVITLQRILFIKVLREAQISKEDDIYYRYVMQNCFEIFFQVIIGILITIIAVYSISHFSSPAFSVLLFLAMAIYVLVFIGSLIKEHPYSGNHEKLHVYRKKRSIILLFTALSVIVTLILYAVVGGPAI